MRSFVIKSRKSRKGLSGAVTALILVIASVMIALIVVAFAFGILNFGGTPTVQQSGTPTVQQSGAAYITGSKGSYTLTTILVSSGNVTINLVAVNVALTVVNYHLTAGVNSLKNFALPSSASLSQGETYTVILVLSDGQIGVISATYQ